MLPEVPYEAVADAAERTAEELLWEAGVDGPPIDAFAVAQRLGLVVATGPVTGARGQLARFAHVGSPGGGVQQAAKPSVGNAALILLSPDARPERRQWAVAHELGEWAAVRVFDRLGVGLVDTPSGAREATANALACRLLLPARWLRADGAREDWDLFALKRVYSTASHELIARRTLEQIDVPAVVAVMDHGQPAWRRSNFARSSAPWAPEERATWRHCHESSQPADAGPIGEHLVRTRAWPVHEPGWRREVVLTEYSDHS